MDYEELNLKSGDILTAKHVAHIEAGIDFATAEITKIKNARIILRNDTTENWATSELILMKGEPAAEFTVDNTVKLKIGDGINTWANLPYVAAQAENNGETPENPDIEIPADLEERLYKLETSNGELVVKVGKLEDALPEVTASISELDERIIKLEEDIVSAVETAEHAAAEVSGIKTSNEEIKIE